MVVGIEVSGLNKLSKKRGVGLYTENLIKSLKEYSHINLVIIEKRNNYQKVDLIHYPFFDFFKRTIPLKKKYPTLVTIHDCIPLKFPQHYPSGIKGMLNFFYQKTSLKNLKGIITDSLSSKKDIEQFLSVPDKKIFPIHLAPSKKFKKISNKIKLNSVKKKFKLPENFALYVGSVNWNKNISNMTKATLDVGVDLVLAGGDFLNRDNLTHPELKDFKSFLENYKDNPKIHMLGYVNLDNLVAVYNLASATLLVSKYEGFGLPILESQASGTPVITSNNSSMSEIAGNGAFLVDPNNIESISSAIKRIMNDTEFRGNLIKNGYKNLENFSWKKTAEETIKVYESIIKTN